MIEFEYIGDDRLRASLVSDYAEFRTSLSSEAWKSALVLIGSIVEALLVDHLLAVSYEKRTKRDPLKMQLGELIHACEAEGALSPKTVALSTVIQSYRNLIHPGRAVRLGETPSKSAAVVAGELLQMIVDEISAKRRADYGFTAAQIVAKLERDESALAIHEHFLREVPEPELERLLLTTIPERYFQIDSMPSELASESDSVTLNALVTCFRSAFGMAPDEVKKKVMRHFVGIIKQEDKYRVLTYEAHFFKGSDLQYLSTPDAKLVKEHFLSRVRKGVSIQLLAAMEGLGAFLEKKDVNEVTDSLVRATLFGESNDLKTDARKHLSALWMELPSGPDGSDRQMMNRLDAWISYYQEHAREKMAQTVREIKREVEEQAPF